ncbi:putative ATPase [Thermocatellispora tengchongensis]|uniref:Putative ATPase n=1 Tax=Thermocatellispora tengchongensis TaxID=1073253 RepID=A0A840NZN2_9ACTN|nr:LuxR C-terminal-related transcriptional regulator [Thermocatellispora tengchongensis]MBB5131666.1 putative ATPase [Thermocatellispora tengchongensis]
MAGRRPGNLAAEVTTFVGRAEEVASGVRLLASAHPVTVTGPAGVGKSRLALRIAGTVARRFRDGLWHAELSPLPSEQAAGDGGRDAVAATVAGIMGLDVPPRARDVARALSDRRALILLDTCDHVPRSAARLVEALLAEAPRVRVLATTRTPLGTAGERVLRLAPLPVTGPANAAVTLFAHRAEAVDPDFAPVPEVAEICRRLDGLPLAIELAAARMRSLSARDLLARLDDGFALLAHPGEAPLPRHRDLRAAIAWSHDLCDEPQRALWEALAALPGPFDTRTATGLAGEAAALLPSLVERSIVLADPGTGGYRLPEPYRWYALERRGAAYAPAAGAPHAGMTDPEAGTPRIAVPVTEALSARELQIAELIAEGRSNPQIAAHLLIAKRTVDAHVRNILAKGALASRTQVAAWIAERDKWSGR